MGSIYTSEQLAQASLSGCNSYRDNSDAIYQADKNHQALHGGVQPAVRGNMWDEAETGEKMGNSKSESYARARDGRTCSFALTLLSPVPWTAQR